MNNICMSKKYSYIQITEKRRAYQHYIYFEWKITLIPIGHSRKNAGTALKRKGDFHNKYTNS